MMHRTVTILRNPWLLGLACVSGCLSTNEATEQEFEERPVFRSTDDPVVPIGEVGLLSASQAAGEWTDEALLGHYHDPVVIMNTLGFADNQPAHMRARGDSTERFEWKIEPWAYLEGGHITETIPYLVVEAGEHRLTDGRHLNADSVLVDDGWVSVSFDVAFEEPPVVLAGVMSDNEDDPVVVRIRHITTEGFEIRLQEEQLADGTHIAERVGWVAAEAGVEDGGTLTLDAGRTTSGVNHQCHTLTLGGGFLEAPVVLANLTSFNGGDPAGVRLLSVESDSVQLFVEEEQSADGEVVHPTEEVSYMAWSGPGVFRGLNLVD